MKKIVGWLCFAALLSTLGFAACYVYLTLAPFFRGGEVRYYTRGGQEGAVADLARQLAERGPDESDAEPVRRIVTDGTPFLVRRGWDAVGQIVETWDTAKSSTPSSNVAWAAVADARGNIVESYPEAIHLASGRIAELSVLGWLQVLPGKHFRGSLDAYPVTDTGGKTVGSLVVGTTYPLVAVIPPQAEVHSRVSPIGALIAVLASLLAFVILLPVWVGMDAAWRGMRPFAWAFLVVVTGLIGFTAYLIARLAPPGPCPNCGEQVASKFRRCPACGVLLLSQCPVCGVGMKGNWQYCPVCSGTPLQTPDQQFLPTLPSPLVPPEPGRSLLSATVLDSDGVPVPNASISVRGPTALDGLTNSLGRFDARRLESGQFVVTAARAGYDSAKGDVEVAESAVGSVQLILKALPGAISGRVLDRAALQPVSGARVFIDSGRLERSVTTGGDGAFLLEDIPLGPYIVCVDAGEGARQRRLAEVRSGRQVVLDFVVDRVVATAEQESQNADV